MRIWDKRGWERGSSEVECGKEKEAWTESCPRAFSCFQHACQPPQNKNHHHRLHLHHSKTKSSWDSKLNWTWSLWTVLNATPTPTCHIRLTLSSQFYSWSAQRSTFHWLSPQIQGSETQEWEKRIWSFLVINGLVFPVEVNEWMNGWIDEIGQLSQSFALW